MKTRFLPRSLAWCAIALVASGCFILRNRGPAGHGHGGSYDFGECVATVGKGGMTCSEYCRDKGTLCHDQGCIHPFETGSRFGAIYYQSDACEGVPFKNYQCDDPFDTGAGVQCCCVDESQPVTE